MPSIRCTTSLRGKGDGHRFPEAGAGVALDITIAIAAPADLQGGYRLSSLRAVPAGTD